MLPIPHSAPVISLQISFTYSTALPEHVSMGPGGQRKPPGLTKTVMYCNICLRHPLRAVYQLELPSLAGVHRPAAVPMHVLGQPGALTSEDSPVLIQKQGL